VRGLIDAGQFTARFFSWVCVHGRHVLKIPRVHGFGYVLCQPGFWIVLILSERSIRMREPQRARLSSSVAIT
jgi:hypothetical protein